MKAIIVLNLLIVLKKKILKQQKIHNLLLKKLNSFSELP